MTTAAVRLWGRRIGAVTWLPERELAVFEYDPDFARLAPVEVAPQMMPKAEQRQWLFPDLPRATYHGLPGLLADALPDRFGRSLLDQWLQRSGRDPASVNPVERLCYIGQRAMGALVFEPAHDGLAAGSGVIAIEELVELANRAMNRRGLLDTSLATDSVAAIIQVRAAQS